MNRDLKVLISLHWL